jgi:hypothetical protein
MEGPHLFFGGEHGGAQDGAISPFEVTAIGIVPQPRLAADVYGLPWKGIRADYLSHGTWPRHDACGMVAKLGLGAVDCPTCGPEPGSRTHHARRDDPYLLYLVCTKRWQKFGVGDQQRVRARVRGGAEVIQAPFARIVLAERTLKQRHGDATPRRVKEA